MEFVATVIEPPRNLFGVWVYLDVDGVWQITSGVVGQVMAYNKANLMSGSAPISYAPIIFTGTHEHAEQYVEEYKDLVGLLNANSNQEDQRDESGAVQPEPVAEENKAAVS